MKKIIGISSVLVILDQLIKIVIDCYMNLNHSIEVVPNFFNITYVRNIGAAFSMFSGSRVFLVIIALLAIYLIYHILIKNQNLNSLNIWIYSLLISGIVANMFDRIFRGYVIDYLDFRIFHYHFPVFNLADICIVIGSFLLIITTIKEEDHGNKNNA